MHKLICTKFTHYDDFYKNENYKKYREKGIDNCIIPCEEWMNEMGNKYYFIWEPQTKRRTKMEVVFGEISRDEYGYPKVYGTYLDKPYHIASWNSYFPRYCWGEAHDFMGIKLTDDNKLSCLVFDNEQEAREYCNKYNKWKENKNKEKIKIEPFRHIEGITYRDYYSGELLEAHRAVNNFIYDIIKKYNLNEYEYKVEYRQVGIVNSDDNNPKYGDNYIKSIVNDHGEIVAMAYNYRNDWNGASVVFVNYLIKKEND